MFAQLASRLNTRRLRFGRLGASPNDDSKLLNMEKRFARWKSPLKFRSAAVAAGGGGSYLNDAGLADGVGSNDPRTLAPNSDTSSYSSVYANQPEEESSPARTIGFGGIPPDRFNDRHAQQAMPERLIDVNRKPVSYVSNDANYREVISPNIIHTLIPIEETPIGNKICLKKSEKFGGKLRNIIKDGSVNMKNQFGRFKSPFRIRADDRLSNERLLKEDHGYGDTNSKPNNLISMEYEHNIDEIQTTYKHQGDQSMVTTMSAASKYRKSVDACGDFRNEKVISSGKNNPKYDASTGINKGTKSVHGKRNIPSHQSNSTAGFRLCKHNLIAYTAFIRMLTAEWEECENLRRMSARKLRGLEQQFNCSIELSDKPTQMRGKRVYKLEIRGASYREVTKCRNSLPNCLVERLITAAESTTEEMWLSDYRGL